MKLYVILCFCNWICFLFPLLQCCDAWAGWPLSHGRRGVLTHLVAPIGCCSGGTPPSDAYLSLDVASAGLTVNWVGAGARLRSRLSTDTAAMLAGDLQQLSATLKHLVAVVDRSVHRVPLDRIPYPCYGCQDRTCQPPTRRSHQTFAADNGDRTKVAAQQQNNGGSVFDDADNSIPHIDSDPEDSSTQDRSDPAVDNDGKFQTTVFTFILILRKVFKSFGSKIKKYQIKYFEFLYHGIILFKLAVCFFP